ncbi:MAG: LapA family protein [Candidatus Dadabacteria bacterium]|nr:LapA family protein [Candidatus Dadabacteria bacterium]NIS07978.1 LapA family protein [Candidatus Dadabacteria bacterium]NIV43099.1 DUF1049 domain-containing protein [Candidatus Dadabacteria bacterium]NIX14936.1 DUF1049 domain-containing protein [Candidatus Dadabacteria bacterium]NIY21562.1 DUF1049 domain-containing protein [Candidatus Dadabacteria bacterium]
MSFKLIGGIILGCIITIICLQNYEIIELNFLFWKISVPAILLILSVFVCGFLCGLIYKNIRRIRK